jgi:hypothetical protein
MTTTSLPHGTDHRANPGGRPPADQGEQAGRDPEYALYAVLACLLVLAALDATAIAVFGRDISNAVAVIGAISSPIVAMVSAYFGVKVGARAGSASAAAASKARQQAENEAKSLLGHMTPEQAKPLMRQLGIPVA